MKAIVYDTETTGLTLHPQAPVDRQPQMIEFGAVLYDIDRRCVEEVVSILINPGVPLTEEITAITGLRDADLRDAPRFAEVLPQLRRVFGEAGGVIAHNLPFDKAILRGELMRVGCEDFPWPAAEMCTVQLFRDEWGRNPKLIELHQHILGEPLAQTHRALDDVRALVRILERADLWQFLN